MGLNEADGKTEEKGGVNLQADKSTTGPGRAGRGSDEELRVRLEADRGRGRGAGSRKRRRTVRRMCGNEDGHTRARRSERGHAHQDRLGQDRVEVRCEPVRDDSGVTCVGRFRRERATVVAIAMGRRDLPPLARLRLNLERVLKGQAGHARLATRQDVRRTSKASLRKEQADDEEQGLEGAHGARNFGER